MLPRVLLHVVAATRGINRTNDILAFLKLFWNDMNDSSILFFGNFRYWIFLLVRKNKLACVVTLPAAGRVKRCTIQHHSNPSVSLRGLKHTCFKVIKEGIVIVETLSHGVIARIAMIVI